MLSSLSTSSSSGKHYQLGLVVGCQGTCAIPQILVFFNNAKYPSTAMATKLLGKNTKLIIVISSTVALGVGAYAAYRYWKRKDIKYVDEGFEDESKVEESLDKKILVLGLESCGKSTLLACLKNNIQEIENLSPTEGFNVFSITNNNYTLSIWDLGGKMRQFWCNFLQDTDLLVFVIDSTSTHNLTQAVTEVRSLLGDERLKYVPLLVVASKQDLPGALSVAQIAIALDTTTIQSAHHRIQVIGTQCPPNVTTIHDSVKSLKKIMESMVTS